MNKSLATIQGIFNQGKCLALIKNVLCAFKLVLFLFPSYLYEYICICFPGGGNAVFLPGEFHGQRGLAGHSPWGCKESDTTERLSVISRYIYWRRRWHPNPVLLPGKSHGQRSLVGYSPWGWEESNTTEQLHFHFLLSCIGEGNGNPLQCSSLENPRDGGIWWAAIYGVTQSRTRLKRISSSSRYIYMYMILAMPLVHNHHLINISLKIMLPSSSPSYNCCACKYVCISVCAYTQYIIPYIAYMYIHSTYTV